MKEYRTIREVNGPLMVVDQVEGVTYDELAEIQLSDGTLRRCKVLEVNGDRAVVQLFENSAGINLRGLQDPFSGASPAAGQCPRICWAVSLTAWASPSTAAPTSAAGEVPGHQRPAHEPRRP